MATNGNHDEPTFMFSIDGGLTYQPCDGVRIIYTEASENDYGLQDLHVNISSEGIILDVYDQKTDSEVATTCIYIDDLVDLCI
jgi:hypothetical protein